MPGGRPDGLGAKSSNTCQEVVRTSVKKKKKKKEKSDKQIWIT